MSSNRFALTALLVAAFLFSGSSSNAATPVKPGTKPTAKPAVKPVVKPAVKAPVAKAPVKPAVKPATAAVAHPATTGGAAGGLAWKGVTEGFALAKKTKKPVMVDFYTDWCGWCKVMDRDTFHNPAVSAMLAKDFIVVKANAEDGADGQQLAGKVGISGFPTTVFFDSEGTPKHGVTGFVQPDSFQSTIQDVLANKLGKKAPATATHPAH